MPGMLFTATPSNDVVKELQDKVISIQDHEVSFLNDTIANMLSTVGIAATVVAGVFTLAFAYVTYSNNHAQKIMNEAEGRMNEANDMMKKAEEKIGELELRISETNKIVEKADYISNIAQEKLEELEKEQRKLNKTIEILKIVNKNEAHLNHHNSMLDTAKEKLVVILNSDNPSFNEQIIKLDSDCSILYEESKHIRNLMNIESTVEGLDEYRELIDKLLPNFAKHVLHFAGSVGQLESEISKINLSVAEQ
ncbi:TPA: spbB protein [Bacillus mycoides]|nr:spbB protein [Bacillus mycoides]HDR7630677.1 spbB protein [Bacillus mycoides]